MIAKKYRVKLTLTEPLLGTVPKNEDVYSTFIASKVLKRQEETDSVINETALISEELATIPDIGTEEARGWTGFHTDDEGPFIYDYQVKGFLKEAGNLIKDFAATEKIRALRSKIDNYVYVFPRRLRLQPIEPRPLERPLRALTMQGPRVTLMRSDVVAAGATISFELHVLPVKDLSEELLTELLEFGMYKGLGQWRNGSYGRFEYELEAL